MEVASGWASRSRRKRLALAYRDVRLRLKRMSIFQRWLALIVLLLFGSAVYRTNTGTQQTVAVAPMDTATEDLLRELTLPSDHDKKVRTKEEEDSDFAMAMKEREEQRAKLIGKDTESRPVEAPKCSQGNRYPPKLEIQQAKRTERDRTVPSAGDKWAQMAPEIAVVVKTGKEVALQRLEQMKAGWFDERDFPNLLIVSDEANDELGIMSLPDFERQMYAGLSASRFDLDNVTGIPKNILQGGWRGDKDKNLPAFLALYMKFPKARFYLMIDDDTYLFLHNIAVALEEIWDQAYTLAQWGGNPFRISCQPWLRSGTTMGLKNPVFAHGGSGILLNHRALEYLVPFIPDCIKKYAGCWAGDMMLAACLLEHGVPCNLRFRHFTGEPPREAAYGEKLGTLWHSRKRIGTLHKMNATEYASVAEWHAKTGPYKASFSSLREHLEETHILTRPPNADKLHQEHHEDKEVEAAPDQNG